MGMWVRRGVLLAVGLSLSGCVVVGPANLIDQDGDGFPYLEDCDDEDPDVGSRYLDKDGDGYGDEQGGDACDAPGNAPTVTSRGDCDDEDPSVHPEQPEQCDGKDNNCVEGIDEGFPAPCAPVEDDLWALLD